MNVLTFHVQRTPWNNRTGIWLTKIEGQKCFDLQEVKWVETDPFAVNGPPTHNVSDAEIQQLADALWTAGFRPSAGHGSVGQLQATEHHLRDMRRLAFSSHKALEPT